jgi:N-acetylglucosamine-6-phosphate deacetylase
MDGTLESLEAVSETLARHGTTSFLATTLSAPDGDTEAALRGYAAHSGKIASGARPVGIHMEGPFLNPLRRGTHDAGHLRQADAGALQRFVEWSAGNLRKITVAPEMDPGLELTREATRHGIHVSIGHTDATYAEAEAAIDAGALHATHTFNAMRPFHHREPGVIGAVLNDPRVFAEVIADGVHVHPSALHLLVKSKGVDRILLVTDGLSAVDMPDGLYPLGDKTIVVEQGQCRDPDGKLAGSTLTLDRAVRNLVEWFDLPVGEAITAASASPARAIHMDRSLGIVAPGASADLVFLDQDLQVLKTMVAGRIVYSR